MVRQWRSYTWEHVQSPGRCRCEAATSGCSVQRKSARSKWPNEYSTLVISQSVNGTGGSTKQNFRDPFGLIFLNFMRFLRKLGRIRLFPLELVPPHGNCGSTLEDTSSLLITCEFCSCLILKSCAKRKNCKKNRIACYQHKHIRSICVTLHYPL